MNIVKIKNKIFENIVNKINFNKKRFVYIFFYMNLFFYFLRIKNIYNNRGDEY